jgi:hypothetical protein
MRPASKKATQSFAPETVAADIERLAGMSRKELRAAWALEFGRQPPVGLWPDLLLRSLAWRLQEKAFGGHDKATLRLLKASAQKKAGDQRCQRLKAGTVLIREFAGVRHTVTIMPHGFVWQERSYSSLTAIARIITGTSWNGPRFFGLRAGEVDRGEKQQERAA